MTASGFGPGSIQQNPSPTRWISFRIPGEVELSVGKVELGQGIRTALGQIAADRLNVAIERIRFAEINTRQSPNEGVTSGSFSIQHSGAAISSVCREVRSRAIRLAAAQFGVEPSEVKSEEGRFFVQPNSQYLTYWDLPADQLLDFRLVDEPLSSSEKGAYVGRSTPRIDLPGKIFGNPSFIHDIYLPNILYGRVVRPPGKNAKLAAYDERIGSRFPDLKIVRSGSFLGVIAANEYHAVRAAELLARSAEWITSSTKLPEHSKVEEYLAAAPSETTVVDQRVSAQKPNSARSFASRFSRPYLAHASIGPSCALAHWRNDQLDVWTHSQGIFNFKQDLMIYLRRDHPHMAEENVVIHHADGAGCYGHNPADDVAFDAVILANEADGRPVKVQWSRADELGKGPFGPSQLVELQASVDADGQIIDWSHEIWSNGYTLRPGRSAKNSPAFLAATELDTPFEPLVSLDPPMSVGGGADRNSIPLYDFPSWTVTKHRLLDMPIRVSAIRALGAFANVFATETFMSEIACTLGRDPVEFRLAHLSCPRARAVIQHAIDGAEWWKTTKEADEGHGLAYSRYKNKGAWCAVAARIKADERIHVLDLSIAVDVGAVINPDGVSNQIEGGAVQSCSWTLHEGVHFDETGITSISWETYPILQFSETPRISVAIIDRPDQPSLGAGEAAQGPVAAALGNAVADALGVWVKRLPLTTDNIVAAMS